MHDEETYNPPYGDLTRLNKNRLILDSVGKKRLTEIVQFFQELLETSSAVYEKNGDYALGIFSSSWCRLMDSTSRQLCETEDDQEALESGKWLCHESCWTEASKTSIKENRAVDIECNGGIHMYAVPITVNGEPIGSINLGYGDPPRDPETLKELSQKYNISLEELTDKAHEYQSRPEYIISAAKKRLELSAKLIAEIVERKQIETTLRESNNRLNGFMASATDGFLIMNKDLKIVDANQNWLNRAGVTKDIYGTPIDDLFPVLRENGRLEAYKKVIETGEPIEFSRVTAPSGSGLIYHIKAFKVGEGLGLISRNITDRVRQENHIEYLYQVLLAIRNVNQLIVTEKDRHSLLQRACDMMVETKGYNHCRIMYLENKGKIDHIYDTSPEVSKTGINKVELYPCIDKLTTDKVTVFSDPETACNGCPLYSGATDYSILGMKLNHENKIYGYFTAAVPEKMTGPEELSLFKEVAGDLAYALHSLDLEDARDKAVKELEASEKRYRNLLESGMDGVTVNILGKLVYVNNRFAEMIGYTREELIGTSIRDLHAPEYRELIEERTRLRHNGVKVPNYYEVELIRKDGTRLPVAYSVSRIIYEGEPASLTYIRDISQLKQMTEALQKSEAQYRVLVESAQDIIFKHDLDGNITYINQQGIELVGLTKDEILSRNVFNFIPKENFEDMISRYEKRRSGYTETMIYRTHVEVQGRKIHLELTSSPITEEDDRIVEVLVIARDINKRLKDEEQLEKYRIRLEELHNYSVQLSGVDSITELAEHTINALQGILEFEFCDIGQRIGDTVRIISSSRPGKIHEMPLDGPGVVVRAIKTGETQYVPDTRKDPDYVPGGKVDTNGNPYQILSELAVPVRIDDKVHLVLNMERSKLDAFTNMDRRLVEILAAHTASSLEILYEKERRGQYSYKLEALYLITEELPRTTSMDEVAKQVEYAVKGIMGYELGSLGIVKSDSLHHKYAWGVDLDEDYILPLDGPGVTVRAVNTGELQRVRDTELDPDYATPDNVEMIRSELCVPIKIGNKVVAVINVESKQRNAFSEEDTSLLSILAEHVGSTLNNLNLLEKERDYTQRLEAMHRASIQLSRAETEEKVYNIILEVMEEDLDYTWAGIAKIGKQHIRYVRFTGEAPDNAATIPLTGKGVTVRAVKTGETQLVKDTKNDPDYLVLNGIHTPNLSELVVPVNIDNKVEYLINLESSETDAFTDTDVRLVELLARQISAAIENIRLLETRKRYGERLTALNRFGAEIDRLNSIEEIAVYTMDSVLSILKHSTGSFGIVKNDAIQFIELMGPTTTPLIPLDQKSITTRAVKTCLTQLVSDTRHDPDYLNGRVNGEETLSELDVPIVIDDKCVAVINLESSQPNTFTSEDANLVEIMAEHIASNIKRINQSKKILETERRVIREQERAEQAIELEEMKTSFIRTATHELRTPLTSIKGYTELAQGKIDKETMPDINRYFDVILRNTERLEALTTDLLDLQRIESGRLTLEKEKISLHELVDNVALEMTPILESRNQRLTVKGEDHSINADRIRLMQVLVNLVMNASKYSPKGSEIKIIIEQEDDRAKVSVIDNGVGIKEEDMHKLFKPFPGIHVKGVKDSTGLGLSICRGLVELHGGEIWAESEGPRKGSKFAFTIPIHKGD